MYALPKEIERDPSAAGPGYVGADGGLVGAYSRLKRRHQLKYSSNPNPNRAAAYNAKLQHQASKEAEPELTSHTLDLGQLAAILKQANSGIQPPDAEVWSIMLQCNPDANGRIKIKQVRRAVALFQQQGLKGQEGQPLRATYPIMEPEPVPSCQCVIS